MKRKFRLIGIILAAVMTLSVFSVGSFASADSKPVNNDTMTVYTNWWGVAMTAGTTKIEYNKAGQAPQAFGYSPSAEEFNHNRYQFVVNAVPDDTADYFFNFSVRGVAEAPWGAASGSFMVRFHKGYMAVHAGTVDKNIDYQAGSTIHDGEDHVIEVILDDESKTATMWIDDYKYVETLDTLNEVGRFGFNACCGTVTVTDPKYGNTASSVIVTESSSKTEVEVGSTLTLGARVNPSSVSQSVTWSSDNEAVATVANGVVTGVSQGTAKIKATTQYGVTGEYTVTVTGSAEVLPEIADIWRGEYSATDSALSGVATIIFCSVDYDTANANSYGVKVTVSGGGEYVFTGRAISAEGKFGIALFEIPVGEYSVQAFCVEDGGNTVYSAARAFTVE
ncbi:MAG: Ig-like domain-containing protein [Christensenellales bacterium]